MQIYKLERTGQRPLSFAGEVVADVTTRLSGGQEHNRWHQIVLYQTKDGEFVLRVGYRTLWQGELNHNQVSGPGCITEMEQELRMYDPCEFMKGFPPGVQFRERQVLLEKDLRLRFETAVSELLEEFPEEV